MIHVDQDHKNCVICATYSVMRGVNLKEAVTVDEAPTAPPHQALALRLSGDTRIQELLLSDETKIRRDLEFRSITQHFKISTAFKNRAFSCTRAAEVLDYLKEQLDGVNIAWEITPKEDNLTIRFNHFNCRVWNHATCSWTTITSKRFNDHHGIAN